MTNRWTPGQGGNGISTRYSYDRAGNLTNVDYPTNPDLHLAYDGLNRLTNLVDAVGTSGFS